jgi:capsular exopolysaccharide synthesis family protein
MFGQIEDQSRGRKALPRPGDIAPVQKQLAYAIDIPNSNARQDEDRPYGLLDHLGVLWKFKYSLAGCILAGIIAAAAYSFKQAPAYRADLQLEVQELNQNFMNARDVDPAASTSPIAPDSYVQVQVQVLQSEELLARVIKRLKLDEKPEYFAQTETPLQRIGHKLNIEKLLSALPDRSALVIRKALDMPPKGSQTPQEQAMLAAKSNLKVKAAAQSSLVQLYYTSPDRHIPAEFLNALAAEFVAHTMETRWAGTERTVAWLNNRLRAMRTDLEHSERKLQDYARRSGILDTNGRETVGEEKLRQIQAELSKAQADRTVLQAKNELISSSAPEQLPEVRDGLLLRDYKTRLADLERDRSQLTASMKPEHYKVQRVDAQIAELKALIAKELNNIVGRIQNDYQAAQKREALLTKSYEQQFKAVSEQSERSVPINALKREVDSNRQFYLDMLQKVNSAGVATAIRASNIRIVDAAREPYLPYKPDLALNIGLGCITGLLLGTLFCFVREARQLRNRKLWKPGESSQLLRMPELGVIPTVKLAEQGLQAWKRTLVSLSPGTLRRGNNQLAAWQARPPMLNDSFHSALDSLLCNSPAETTPQVIAITSALPQEGKSTIAGYLALAMSEIGKRVLLIDADLRNPTLHERFMLKNETGLSHLLQSTVPDNVSPTLVSSTGVEGSVWVLTSGPVAENAPSLLASSRLAVLLQELRGQFDTILIDTPPVLLFPDARLLGRRSDGVVLVVRSNQNPLAAHQEAAGLLQLSNNVLLGTILNGWEPSPGLAYGSYYTRYAQG